MTDSATNPFPRFDGRHLKTIRQRRGESTSNCRYDFYQHQLRVQAGT